MESLRTYELHCPASGCALQPHLCLSWAFWVIPCYVFPRSLSWCEVVVSFTFVMGFVANIQAPPLLLGLLALLYRPNQRETIAMGDCYILCGRSGVTWSALATHCQRCEWFPFATGCNRKELSKTTVSFWLRLPSSRECCLSATERSVSCPLSLVLFCYRSVSSL